MKGGYKIIDLKGNDLTSTSTIDGIYESIEGNYRKALLLSGIVIDDVEKDDTFVTANVTGDNYVIIAYGRTITITPDDEVSSVLNVSGIGKLDIPVIEGGMLSTDPDDHEKSGTFTSEQLSQLGTINEGQLYIMSIPSNNWGDDYGIESENFVVTPTKVSNNQYLFEFLVNDHNNGIILFFGLTINTNTGNWYTNYNSLN